MKVEFPVFLDGRTIFMSNEVAGVKEAFKWIADMQDVFGDLVCERNGVKSDSVKLRVRESEGNDYYEAVCYRGEKGVMWAKKRYGVNKDKDRAGLYPKTKDENGAYLPNNGWLLYNKETNKEE